MEVDNFGPVAEQRFEQPQATIAIDQFDPQAGQAVGQLVLIGVQCQWGRKTTFRGPSQRGAEVFGVRRGHGASPFDVGTSVRWAATCP